MRPFHLGLVAFSALTGLATAFGPGCTTTIVDPIDEPDATLPIVDATVADVAPPRDSGRDTGIVDSGRDTSPPVDSGPDARPDTGVDAGGPPLTGAACTNVGFIYTKKCGFCGFQEAACEADMKVGGYGICQGEVVNGCTPGATRNQMCGLCGTKAEICQNNCQWASGACTGEPANACSPGNVKYTTAGCTEVNTFRKQTCGATCQYGAPEPPPCKPKDTAVTISNTVGGQVVFDGELSKSTDVIAKINTGTCPVTRSTTMTSYAYIEVKNADAVPHTVDLWFDAPVGGTDIDTIVTYYNGATIPPADLLMCVNTVNDFCSTLPCTGSWSGLVGTNGPVVPAGGSIVVYHAAYFGSNTGPFQMFLKTTN